MYNFGEIRAGFLHIADIARISAAKVRTHQRERLIETAGSHCPFPPPAPSLTHMAVPRPPPCGRRTTSPVHAGSWLARPFDAASRDLRPSDPDTSRVPGRCP